MFGATIRVDNKVASIIKTIFLHLHYWFNMFGRVIKVHNKMASSMIYFHILTTYWFDVGWNYYSG
jgi:hypothetical protein